MKRSPDPPTVSSPLSSSLCHSFTLSFSRPGSLALSLSHTHSLPHLKKEKHHSAEKPLALPPSGSESLLSPLLVLMLRAPVIQISRRVYLISSPPASPSTAATNPAGFGGVGWGVLFLVVCDEAQSDRRLGLGQSLPEEEIARMCHKNWIWQQIFFFQRLLEVLQ